MKKWWWLIAIAVVLLIFGLVHDVSITLWCGLGGTGLMLIGLVGDTLLPSANKIAWFDRRTGKRVHPSGKPYYTGSRNFILSSITTLFLGFIGGMAIYGIVAIIQWISPNFDLWKLVSIVMISMLVIVIVGGIIASMFSG